MPRRKKPPTDLFPALLAETEVGNEISVRVRPEAPIDEVEKVRAKAYSTLLKEGFSPDDAAAALKSTPKKMMKSMEARKEVRKLVETWTMPAEVRKLMIKAAANKAIVEGALSDDPKVQKLGLDAARLASGDPEVGLLPANQANEIQGAMSDHLKKVLNKLELPALPEEAVKMLEEPNIVDGETEDV